MNIIEYKKGSLKNLRSLTNCYGLNVYVPLKFVCWSLIPIVIVFEGRALERWLGHEGGVLTNGISVLITETPESILAPFHHVRLQGKDRCLWPGSRSSPHTISASDLILVFSPPDLWEICLLFKPLNLWCFYYSSQNWLRNKPWKSCDNWEEIKVKIGFVLFFLKLYFKTFPIRKIMQDLY